jgi:transposase
MKVYGTAVIAHDRFHISQHLNEAVDKVRAKRTKCLSSKEIVLLVPTLLRGNAYSR